MTEQTTNRPSEYFEAARSQAALIRAALIGIGHEPDAVALAAAVQAVERLQGVIEAGLQRAAEQDSALQNLARAVGNDETKAAAVVLSALPAGSEAVN